MIEKLTDLERALGGKLERKNERRIPGLDDDEDVSTVYFCVPSGQSPGATFFKITGFTNPPLAQSGGATEVGCIIETPDGVVFHGLEFHGDLEGWHADIKAGASAANVVLARLRDGRLEIENGQSFNLDECRIAFI